MKNIIICATQRCGSTMVVEDMRNTGVLGNPEEWFIPWDPQKKGVDWRRAYHNLLDKSRGETELSAYKVMANQVANIDQCFSTFSPARGDSLFPAFLKLHEDFVWVSISRDDVVGQAVSRHIAQRTGVNHAIADADDDHFPGRLLRGYKDNYNADVPYSYDDIFKYLGAVIVENLFWRNFFDVGGVTPIALTYEQVVEDKALSYLDGIAEAAGLKGALVKRPRKLVKLGNSVNDEMGRKFLSDAAARAFSA